MRIVLEETRSLPTRQVEGTANSWPWHCVNPMVRERKQKVKETISKKYDHIMTATGKVGCTQYISLSDRIDVKLVE